MYIFQGILDHSRKGKFLPLQMDTKNPQPVDKVVDKLYIYLV